MKYLISSGGTDAAFKHSALTLFTMPSNSMAKTRPWEKRGEQF